ncbi:Hypothetical predicted protein [Marmota monax]|uniref:Oviduct-specific glycoprotein n=1 Tax=Marmota monax TaxID=9995 RepID=A0A5E4D5S9_MARMO|nr:Hypothetical predicted protein [Marmota monax]
MSNNQIVPETLQDEKILYPQFNKLKERNRELKTLLSIGGWNFGTLRFTSMLHTFGNREKFINSTISLLRTHNFDGLDLFFLYPGLRNSPTHDRWKFLFLIEELLSAFQKEALLTNRPRLLLSAAVSGAPHIIQTSYDVNLLGRLLDFINVLSYDFHGSWEKFTGHNSPLYSFPEDPKSSAFAPGPASPGKYTKQAGILAYYEICSFLEKARKDWIGYQHVPYAYKGKEWVGYDDIRSFQEKAKFVKAELFGGAMVWTLDMDDVKGAFCGSGPFPLLYTLNYLLLQDGMLVTVRSWERTNGKAEQEKLNYSGKRPPLPGFTSIVFITADCKTVIISAIDFLHQDGFDGMNLDIEHSEFWGSPTEDKQQFAILSNLRMEPQLCEMC